MRTYRDLCKNVLGMTAVEVSLLLGTTNTELPKFEKRVRRAVFIEAFYAIVDYDPNTAVKAVLVKFLALKRRKHLTEEEVEELKCIAKRFMPRNEYVTWEEVLLARLCQHYAVEREPGSSIPIKKAA